MPFQPSSSSPQGGDAHEGKTVVRVAFLGTPLYEEPEEASRKLAYLNKGTVMDVLGEQNGFLHVRTKDGATGYARRAALIPAGRR